MLREIIKPIAKFFANLIGNIFVVILIGIVGLSTLIAWATGILDFLLQTIKSPTPLWATIAVALLCCVYIYLKVQKSVPSSSSKNSKIKYITIANLKWKVIIHHGSYHKVDEVPLCLKHDLRLLYENYRYFCPEVMKNNCNISFPAKEHHKVYENAKSYIDKELRNKKC